MPGLFQGLEIGKRALMTHQASLQTIGHNIANVDTPGFTRQVVRISSTSPESTVHGPVGTGVTVTDIYQVRDLFLGQQYREAQKEVGQWSYKDKALQQIESVFSEPDDGSLNEVLDQFWNNWSALSSDAENSGYRSSVLASATQLITNLRTLATSLEEQQRSTDADLSAMTANVNQMTAEIASLNQDIKRTELDGSTANDLRDQRDLLIDELSTVVDVNVNQKTDGTATVYMGSMLLVDGNSSFDVGVSTQRDGEKISHKLVWQGSEYQLTNKNGEIAGLVETRDEIIPRYLDQLNSLARSIVEQVNSIHEAGYGLDGTTNVSFFNPAYTDAADLRLNEEIVLDPDKIAASSSSNLDDVANGETASRIADLRDAFVMSNGTATINEYYQSLVSGLGVEAREATSFSGNYELISTQIDNQRQSVQGVSLDEEMTNLVKSQYSYQAAARLITVMDEALDTVISKMGVG
jgi:flagellar hook-associated protein 1